MTADASGPQLRIELGPQRSAFGASRITLSALLLRDLVVLKKHFGEFAIRTLVQPFLLCFVFLFVFPKIGQGIGGHGATEESAFATVLVPGVVGLSVMFQGVQSIALSMAQEFGFTPRDRRSRTGTVPHLVGGSREGSVWNGAGAHLGCNRLAHRLSRSCRRREADISLHWWIIVTLVPLSCITMGSLGLVLGTSFEAEISV